MALILLTFIVGYSLGHWKGVTQENNRVHEDIYKYKHFSVGGKMYEAKEID